ncbi:MAG: SPFH domain-containing protein [Lachnospiraceae bacterium]|nr:SPFH domain-containing protein [Lachnospiraceae bacterium]
MPILSIIKNNTMGNMLCSKVPAEDFNIGSQLIVAEYEEALFMKDGIIEEVFQPGKYTLTTENYPFLTKLTSRLLTGGVSAYNCKVYYINKSHHLELKWGTGTPVRVIDPTWGIEVHVKARGAYTAAVKDGKKFFLKMVGANVAANENDIVKNFRTAFIQHITDSLAEYLTSQEQEVLVVCNRKKALADDMLVTLNSILDEYGMELINFYIESIEIPEDDECMQRIRELRILRQEKIFDREQTMADERVKFNIRRESAQTDRYESGQWASADYERMAIRDQDGNNGWARQEAAEIMKTTAGNEGMGGAFASAAMGIGVGAHMGGMMNQMYDQQAGGSAAPKTICPKCNAVVAPGMKFCGSCGSPIEVAKPKCPECGAELMPGMKFCGNCGKPIAPQKRICPTCGKEVPEGMKFCGDCGTKIDTEN